MINITKPNVKLPNSNHISTRQKVFHSAVQERKPSNMNCIMCKGQHLLYQCKQFGQQSPKERSEFIQSMRLCFNCLAQTHSVKECYSSTCCRRCGRRHHTLLHLDRYDQRVSDVEPVNTEKQVSNQQASKDQESRVVAHLVTEDNQCQKLLATAVVKARSTNGYSQVIRVLIDPCSEGSFITESTAQALGLKRVYINGLVSGIGDGQARSKHMVSLSVESLQNQKYSITIDAYVLSKLTSYLPTSKSEIRDWQEIKTLPLADPTYGLPAKIDMILGVEIYEDIIQQGLMKHSSGKGPIAQKTKLGWILTGLVRNDSAKTNKIIGFYSQLRDDQLLKQFWEIEREPDDIQKKLTKEEIRCEELFKTSTTRNKEGRYIVRLPFKEEKPKCVEGKSMQIALRRFKLLEKRLRNNPVLYEEYKNVIDGYKAENHMIQITNTEEINNSKAVYLPHHPVIRNDKETTKVRVVFDASCKGVNNVSLNDCVFIGPKLQQDLRHILMRWRRHPYCIIADLVQMYRQVCVHEQDADYQRILWRTNPNDPIEHYKLLRLTFGTACAPYLAVKVLQQLAKDEQSGYPRAAKITLEDYYMDDLLTGCETETECIEIYEEMNKLMEAGGFHLQKWSSTSNQLLNHIQEDNKRSDEGLTFKINDMVKVLGICWNKTTDNFEYKLHLPEIHDTYTKRNILSQISRLYDPMGWIAPIIVTAKIFIQKLWKSKLGWDDELTPELLHEWHLFKEDLNNVRNLVIPRWLQSRQGDHVELHAFADASQVAYGATVYMKICNKEDEIHVNLVTAKTKVAPVEKEVSIPRLELCAALLGAKLLYEVAQIMSVPKECLHAWSDSMVVLAWLKGEPSRWNTFVSNRVSEIHTIINPNQWRHIKSQDNPADYASRGVKVSDLIDLKLWWYGPDILHRNETYEVMEDFITTEEQRPIKTLAATTTTEEDFIWTRFSTLTNAMRILSLCRRLLNFRLPREDRISQPKFITVKEMSEVLKIMIKKTQNRYYNEDIRQLEVKGYVKKTSQLYTLGPILDENKILRVGGRIRESLASYDTKHPVIIPSDSHFTVLLIRDAHVKTMHGGPQLMLNFLRSKYWIIRGRERIKKHYRDCVKCLRYSRQNNTQLMGQLPESRLTPTRPFKASGVDFTGFINIRFSPGRGAKSYKGYVCLFVCMSTRAIHLEAVSDLTAKGFIAAFRRFVSRRGQCTDLYSDNGTNFVGAEKELRMMFHSAKSELPTEIAQTLSNDGTTWHFIPPHAPNFGGLWEAGIKSTKSHLKRVMGDSTLTFEELTTVLTQIEACLNSRPISYLSSNSEDPLPLTPGHFLIGEPLVAVPGENYSQGNVSALQRWKMTQKIVNTFWRKWSDEYLVNLNQQYKWLSKTPEPNVDDVVIIKDHNLPPTKWMLGRVIKKHPGQDDITRVLTIKTKHGLIKRPCSKVCLLPKAT